MLDNLVKDNNLRGETFSNDKIQQAVGNIIEETEAEFERNYNKITCDTSFQSPILKKDVPTINDYVYYKSDEHVDTISDSSKQVDAKNDPIKETHIVDGISKLSIGVGSLEPAVIEIIGQGSTPLSINLVTNVLTNSSEQLFMTNLSPLNAFQSKEFVIGLQDESVGGNSNIICTSRDSRNIRVNHSRIGTPGVNKDFFCPRSDTTSKLLSCTRNIEKFNTHICGSATQERNLESSCIEEVGVEFVDVARTTQQV